MTRMPRKPKRRCHYNFNVDANQNKQATIKMATSTPAFNISVAALQLLRHNKTIMAKVKLADFILSYIYC